MVYMAILPRIATISVITNSDAQKKRYRNPVRPTLSSRVQGSPRPSKRPASSPSRGTTGMQLFKTSTAPPLPVVNRTLSIPGRGSSSPPPPPTLSTLPSSPPSTPTSSTKSATPTTYSVDQLVGVKRVMISKENKEENTVKNINLSSQVDLSSKVIENEASLSTPTQGNQMSATNSLISNNNSGGSHNNNNNNNDNNDNNRRPVNESTRKTPITEDRRKGNGESSSSSSDFNQKSINIKHSHPGSSSSFSSPSSTSSPHSLSSSRESFPHRQPVPPSLSSKSNQINLHSSAAPTNERLGQSTNSTTLTRTRTWTDEEANTYNSNTEVVLKQWPSSVPKGQSEKDSSSSWWPASAILLTKENIMPIILLILIVAIITVGIIFIFYTRNDGDNHTIQSSASRSILNARSRLKNSFISLTRALNAKLLSGDNVSPLGMAPESGKHCLTSKRPPSYIHIQHPTSGSSKNRYYSSENAAHYIQDPIIAPNSGSTLNPINGGLINGASHYLLPNAYGPPQIGGHFIDTVNSRYGFVAPSVNSSFNSIHTTSTATSCLDPTYGCSQLLQPAYIGLTGNSNCHQNTGRAANLPLTAMPLDLIVEHVYECIDDEPYTAKLFIDINKRLRK